MTRTRTCPAKIDKKSLKFDVFADALLETLECLPDLAIDSPKAVDHVSMIIVPPGIINL